MGLVETDAKRKITEDDCIEYQNRILNSQPFTYIMLNKPQGYICANKMKKKIVTLLLVAAMTGTMVVGCGSKADDKTSDTKTEQTDDKKDTEEKKELADDEYQYVSAADTVSADGVHVLDVREWENYSKGRVANSEWCPIFPLEDDFPGR